MQNVFKSQEVMRNVIGFLIGKNIAKMKKER